MLLFHTAAPACEERSHTQHFQSYGVQGTRQLRLKLSSGVRESALVLVGAELNHLCGVQLPDGIKPPEKVGQAGPA